MHSEMNFMLKRTNQFCWRYKSRILLLDLEIELTLTGVNAVDVKAN